MHLGPMMIEWYMVKFDPETGDETWRSNPLHNLVVDSGRTEILQFVPGMTGLSAASAMPYLMVGGSSTAADYTDVRLTYEYIDNATRKSPTNVDGDPISVDDITLDPVTVDDCDYRMKLILRYDFDATDGIDGRTIVEAGLNSEADTPATETTQHGNMFNHLVIDAEDQETKENGIPLAFYMICRF